MNGADDGDRCLHWVVLAAETRFGGPRPPAAAAGTDGRRLSRRGRVVASSESGDSEVGLKPTPSASKPKLVPEQVLAWSPHTVRAFRARTLGPSSDRRDAAQLSRSIENKSANSPRHRCARSQRPLGMTLTRTSMAHRALRARGCRAPMNWPPRARPGAGWRPPKSRAGPGATRGHASTNARDCCSVVG